MTSLRTQIMGALEELLQGFDAQLLDEEGDCLQVTERSPGDAPVVSIFIDDDEQIRLQIGDWVHYEVSSQDRSVLLREVIAVVDGILAGGAEEKLWRDATGRVQKAQLTFADKSRITTTNRCSWRCRDGRTRVLPPYKRS
jgi:hypothetical protein